MFKLLLLFTLIGFSKGSILFAQAPQLEDSPVRILILGDSLTEGYGVSKKDAFPAILENLLNKNSSKKANAKKFKVVAAGSSGSTSASAVKRLKWHLKAKPSLLILALGGNDGLRGLKPKATQDNLDKAIDFAKSKNIKVILAGMKIPTNYGKDYRKDFEKTYTELVKKHNLEFIPFLLKDVGGVKKLNLADGIHPNEEGHKIIAKTLYQKLKETL
jgi:acyl-CoA thioesterase-1